MPTSRSTDRKGSLPAGNDSTTEEAFDVQQEIRGALYDAIMLLDESDIVLTSTIGSWKDTLPDEDIATEIKAWSEWVIADKQGKKYIETPFGLTAAEKRNPDKAIKVYLASIFKQTNKKDLANSTAEWAEKRMDDVTYWKKIVQWLNKYIPTMKHPNNVFVETYLKRAALRLKDVEAFCVEHDC